MFRASKDATAVQELRGGAGGVSKREGSYHTIDGAGGALRSRTKATREARGGTMLDYLLLILFTLATGDLGQ